MIVDSYMMFAVPDVICDQILARATEIEKEAATVEGVLSPNDEQRKTDIVWLPYDWYDGVMAEGGRAANRMWNLDINGSENIQVGWYKDGGHYKMHTDVNPFNLSRGFHRKVTIVLCLSDDYEGGELVLEKGPAMRLAKGQGIAFPSMLPHQVNPVRAGVRVTAVKWLTGPFYK